MCQLFHRNYTKFRFFFMVSFFFRILHCEMVSDMSVNFNDESRL